MLYLLILPFAFALLRLFTRKYAFSALTTVSAGVIALTNLSSPAAVLIACALFVSAVGDYFMAHRSGSDRTYALGIGGFFVGHALPSQIVTIIGGDDHAVQIENNAQNRFVHLRKPPC